MIDYNLTEAEEELSKIIWGTEPIKSGELVKICEKEFEWKKSTVYTMLKRLENKNIFKNENSIIKSLINKEDFYASQSEIVINKKFGGSLPRFLTAFTKKNKLTDEDILELERMIDQHKEME